MPLPFDLIPEDRDVESDIEAARILFRMPTQKLIQAARESGTAVEMESSTIYIQGDRFAVESRSEDGRFSAISDMVNQRMYLVLWDQKKVMVIGKEDLDQMKQKTNTAAQQALDHLSPEMRKQVEAAMKNNMRQEDAVSLRSTGKSEIINGFNCTQVIAETESGFQEIWAAEDQFGLSEKVGRFEAQMKQFMPSDEESDKDEWELVPGKVPVKVNTVSVPNFSNPRIKITTIESIQKKTVPPSKFIPPGEAEGFQHVTPADMYGM